MYAFAYLRVSTEEQTVMNQKLVLDRWALGHDFDILSYFEDSSVSGRIPAIRRRGFKDMLEIIKSDSVDAILVYELSRVGRTFWDTLDAIKAIEEYAPLISCSPRETFLQSTEPSVRKLMRRAKESGKNIGRPQAMIDKNILVKLLADNTPRSRIAKDLGISKATLYKELRQM